VKDCENDVTTLESRPPLRVIHDLKFAVYDLDRSLRFYQQVLNAKHLPELDPPPTTLNAPLPVAAAIASATPFVPAANAGNSNTPKVDTGSAVCPMVYGHAGDGDLHPLTFYDRDNPKAPAALQAVAVPTDSGRNVMPVGPDREISPGLRLL
jgi:hypothetical protein